MLMAVAVVSDVFFSVQIGGFTYRSLLQVLQSIERNRSWYIDLDQVDKSGPKPPQHRVPEGLSITDAEAKVLYAAVVLGGWCGCCGCCGDDV